ncbi:hypothetical protein CPC735_033420 [Coccidioides posadasii C735 delta SOWgp]|uniref:Magnesium transporter n=2 Tax=Coccidioides posadasii TaxID=199306 RepID=A0A0J6F516_COCPO|nr:hypothetical protein CPC735_033420 [Coccidioides posadasii C735 delta SOWgp]EER28006.1 hypothetical protein CPC735_033420 [Coccidioides posadasii C735 delta SOWgp]KMM68006.1 hypothetical protein CPAG_04338 [Coccidioides posadasii RMSCC 3488]|eukprot:XP_003070151.1 hypothetical protein CPC735_033420 [Coccidioides posadasii C735 delta SOWgp]
MYFLVHLQSGYSVHEHSTLYGSAHPIPLDITLETLVAVALVIFGLVLGAEKPQPISWSAWAGEIEKKGGLDNPFLGLEDRTAFLDIRAKRKEFADWMRQQDGSSVKR